MESQTLMTKNTKGAVFAQDQREKHSTITLKEEERTKCSIWSRVMGYHRPVSYYNIGKKQEFADRKNFKEPKED